MDGDLVVFFNFRTDRGRQLTEVLTQYNLDDFGMKKMDLSFLTMTSYNDDYENVSTIYENENLKDRYVDQSKNLDIDFILKSINLTEECSFKYKNSKNQRLLTEICLMKLCSINNIELKKKVKILSRSELAANKTLYTLFIKEGSLDFLVGDFTFLISTKSFLKSFTIQINKRPPKILIK